MKLRNLRMRSAASFRVLLLVGALATMLAPVGSARAFPWSIDMYRGPQVEPLSVAPRVMPPGTVPVGGSEPKMTLDQSAALHNPIEPTAKAALDGKALYETNCAPCHGSSGRGDGPVVHVLRVAPPDLTQPASTARADGYIYGVIRNGVRNMPALGDAMPPHERWEVVLYVRSLQPAAPRTLKEEVKAPSP